MTDEINIDKKKYLDVYDDTLFFLDAIVHEYDFYDDLMRLIKDGVNEISLSKKALKKNIDEEWVKVVEDNIYALDAVIRTPAKFIESQEEVKPIELSKNINERSIRHLAQHTNYISKVEGDKITPSKILNVWNDETMMTYENKFVNTLVQRLFFFVNRRYDKIKNSGKSESNVKLEYNSEFNTGKKDVKLTFCIETKENDVSGKNIETTFEERVKKINEIAIIYMNSEFVKEMGKNCIRPPVIRTNAILKNKNLKQCLVLWEFIERYDKVGYAIEQEESSEKPNEIYVKQLYSMLALQYVIYQYNISGDIDIDASMAISKRDTPYMPEFISKLVNKKENEDDDYNVYDQYVRKIVPISQISSRSKLKKEELRIRAAIDIALNVDKRYTIQKSEYESKRKEIEMEVAKLKIARDERLRKFNDEKEMKSMHDIRRRRKRNKI